MTTNLPALYTLTGQYLALAHQLADMDLDATTVADTIEASGLTDDIAQKATGVEMIARSLEMSNPAIDAEIARLTALKTSRCKKAQGLRDYLKRCMVDGGFQKLDSPLFSISLRDNPPAVEIFEPGLIPAEFMKTPATPPPAPDKTAIKAAIKAGIEVPGAKLTQGQRLDVK